MQAPRLAALTITLVGFIASPSSARALRHASLTMSPSATLMSAYHPDRSLLAEMGGTVLERCSVFPTGQLAACHAVSEVPTGMGFGRGAGRIAMLLRGDPALAHGAPVASSMTIAFTLVLPDDAPGARPSQVV